jgi:hypothetical protein
MDSEEKRLELFMRVYESEAETTTRIDLVFIWFWG